MDQVPEVAGIEFTFACFDLFHAESESEVVAEGTGEVLFKAGHTDALVNFVIGGQGSRFELPDDGARERRMFELVFAEEMEGALGKGAILTLKQEP